MTAENPYSGKHAENPKAGKHADHTKHWTHAENPSPGKHAENHNTRKHAGNPDAGKHAEHPNAGKHYSRSSLNGVKVRSPATLAVDWSVLLKYNPPPGYKPATRSAWYETHEKDTNVSKHLMTKYDRNAGSQEEDNVCIILRSILRQLEKEIKDEKSRLKEERRAVRIERTKRREDRLSTDDMSGDKQVGRRRTFVVVSSGSGADFSKSASEDRIRKRMLELKEIQRANSLKMPNFSRSRSLDRRLAEDYRSSYLPWDWSRYSRESGELDDSFDVGESLDVSNSDIAKEDCDSDRTIENENSDSEIVAELGDAIHDGSKGASTSAKSKVGAKSEIGATCQSVEGAMPTNVVQSDRVKRSEMREANLGKYFEVLPNLRRSVQDGATEEKSSSRKSGKVSNKERSKSVDESARSYGLETGIVRSFDRSFDPDVDENQASRERFRTSFEIGTKRSYQDIDKGSKAAPIPKPPRRRPLSQRKSLVRQKPVNKIETLLVGADVNVNVNANKEALTNEDNLKNADSDVTSEQNDVTVNGARVAVGHTCEVASPSADRTSIPAWRRELATPPGMDLERPLSAGTSGYSTDDCSIKTSDSEDETEDSWPRLDIALLTKLHRYVLLLKNGTNMALKVDNSRVPDQDTIMQSSLPLRNSDSMSDLALPDHLGWLTDMSRHHRVWGVVIDMLFCIFEDRDTSKPLEAILLPGCSVRPLVYNSAINGVNGHQPSKTISGIAKFQIVIANESTRKKYLFGVDSQTELDSWYKVLKKASALDHDVANDITSNGSRASPAPNRKRFSLDGEVSKLGYMPTHGSPNRVQKLARSRSPGGSPRDGISPEVNGHHDGHPSPCALIRNDSRRQSVQDFKKMLRREQTEPELSKTQPIKAQHFAQSSPEEKKVASGKKLRSFGGSFESLLKFKRRRSKKDSECDSMSNDDSSSIGSSVEQDSVTSSRSESVTSARSVDISASSSKLKKTKSKQMSRSLDSQQPKTKNNNGIVRRASDIKDRVFPKRSSKLLTKLGDLKEPSMQGFLHHKYHLKWQRLWCVVCRGFFYGFKSQSPQDTASLTVVLANCSVAYVAEKDKRQKRIYIFKLSQENKRSIYLCCSDYKELIKWLTVLQMESNSIISNVQKLLSPDSETESFNSSLSSQSGSIFAVPENSADEGHGSRSRSKKKTAPPKPPRHSSCPPPVSRDGAMSEGGSLSSGTDDTGTSGRSSSQSEDVSSYASSDDVPRHDKALTYVWQNDRGYLFNAIRAKLSTYKRGKSSGDIYNRELPGADNQGLLVEQDAPRKGSRDIRKSRSFSTNLNNMSDTENVMSAKTPKSTTTSPSESPSLRKRHKPLVVKKIAAKDLEAKQSLAGYMERKGLSARWQRYWYILHEGTLFCYLTPDDMVTVDILNLHGSGVTSLIDKFRGKRFVLQLAHDNFTSLHLSVDTREEMDSWLDILEPALKKPSSAFKDDQEEEDNSACAGCESNRKDEAGDKSKQVKQKLLEEMLRQKRELERKQAQRQRRQRNKELDSPESPVLPQLPDHISDEQRTSDVTRLRQRRLSTQLKVDTIQKQITKPTTNKRGLFGFGKSKKTDENKNEFFQDQLKELNTKLHKIDSDLIMVENDKSSDNYDVNQNRKFTSSSGLSPEVAYSERLDNDDDKGSGFKEKMQKWTNKKFSKTSLKRKQQNNTKQNGSVPNLTQQPNGDIINGYGGTDNESEADINMDDNSSLENSVTDLTRPTADLRLDLSSSWRGYNGSGSPSSNRYSRSNSRASNTSNISSPRKEIDPSVMAEIDAFEELTKQVLGARLSKEQPAK